MERFPLDKAAIDSIREIKEQVKNGEIAMNAIVGYFCRQHGLRGKITLADNDAELIIEAPSTAGEAVDEKR